VTGQYRFIDENDVAYAGTGAQVHGGRLMIHDQSAGGKLDATGLVDGAVTVSLKGNGRPRSYTLSALDLFGC
jgi:hypothetical protein